MGFVQMRDAVAAENASGPCLWTNPEKLLAILKGVLIDNSSESLSDIHTYVYMRARPWLDKDTYITSPVMQLAQAVHLYARLTAQSASWDSLRSEWLHLQRKQRSQTKGPSQQDPECIVDKARQKALIHRFKQAERTVKRAMKRE